LWLRPAPWRLALASVYIHVHTCFHCNGKKNILKIGPIDDTTDSAYSRTQLGVCLHFSTFLKKNGQFKYTMLLPLNYDSIMR
jgi:hypothetical protein